MIRANLQLILTCAMNVAGATFENFSPMTSRIDNAQGLWVQGLDIAVPYTLGASTATRKRGFVGRISSMTISRSAESGIVASFCCIFEVLSAVMQLMDIGYVVAITRCQHSMQPTPAHCKKHGAAKSRRRLGQHRPIIPPLLQGCRNVRNSETCVWNVSE